MCVSERGGAASVVGAVEAFEHGGVGPLEDPPLAGRVGLTRVHEDTPLAGAAVHAAVADRVIQTLVLGRQEVVSKH